MKIFAAIIVLFFTSSCAIFSNKETAGEFPIYGNWCGPDHPKAEANPDPVDLTDLACQHHDQCYETNGYLDASCDENLIAELKSFTPDNEIEAIARKAIISYFRKSPKL
ncbi:MAG: phospholipase A2 family protein [Pseudomonadota bacterium]